MLGILVALSIAIGLPVLSVYRFHAREAWLNNAAAVQQALNRLDARALYDDVPQMGNAQNVAITKARNKQTGPKT